MDQNRVGHDQSPQHLEPGSGDGGTRPAISHTPQGDVAGEQQLATMDAIHDAARHADALRAYALPEGSEPAFVFRPVAVPERPGGEQDHG